MDTVARILALEDEDSDDAQTECWEVDFDTEYEFEEEEEWEDLYGSEKHAEPRQTYAAALRKHGS